MKFACTSQSYNRALSSGKIDLKKWLDISKRELHLDGIEIEDKHLLNTDREYLGTLQRLVADNRLVISNIAFYNNFGLESKDGRDKEFTRFEKYLFVSKFLGLRIMRIFAGWPGSNDPQLWKEMIIYLKRCCKLASEAGIVLVVENHNHGGFIKSSADVTRVFQEVGSKNLKLLLDTGNYIDGIVSIEKTIALSGHIHAKIKNLDEQGNEKTIDYREIFVLCKRVNYQGFMSVEYEGEEDEFTAVPRGLNRLREILQEVYSV
ncbi:sugar phosphate isomerase/epimerase [Candidatus Peregrinibacteria bacterium]|nr:sugar phosphate isomerase/epimerase [Candidatus Peregrinibacteria bacterium]